MIWKILLTIFFVMMNAFFVAAEFAIVKVRSSSVELAVRSGSRIAKVSQHIITHLNTYLSATQLGITIASLALGWIGESVVAEIIIDIMYLFGVNVQAATAHQVAFPLAFITITFLHIVFGELAPKSLAIQYPEKVANFVSVPLRIFQIIFGPIVWALNSFANLVIRLGGVEIATESTSVHSPEELMVIVEESSQKGVIANEEQEMIENVFEFSETPVKQIMVPRNKIVAVPINATPEEILERFSIEGYSRMPVYENTIDNILGIVYAKDLLNLFLNREIIILKDIIRPAFFVQENDKINIILKKMQTNRAHLAIVIDEFGGTAGIVTMEDILEELVGEIQDEYDEELPQIEKIAENEFVLSALIPIDDLNDNLPEPIPESDEYETIGGYILAELDRIPELNEKFEIGNYEFQILNRKPWQIERLKMRYIGGKIDEEENL
ncbi:MAG: HlyC/CorC family transporter [Candidatus Kapabacteria bacterium]|nr:HlyC/CorC family transporter [Candidatus Kapabacteria bacterium]